MTMNLTRDTRRQRMTEYCFSQVEKYKPKSKLGEISTHDQAQLELMIDVLNEDFSEMSAIKAKSDPIWKKALEWCKDVPVSEMRTNSISSAVIFQRCGFPLPQTILKENTLCKSRHYRNLPSTTPAFCSWTENDTIITEAMTSTVVFYNKASLNSVGIDNANSCISRFNSMPLSILHELCHFLHFLMIGASFQNGQRAVAKRDYLVSKYAHSHYCEFMAECLSSIMMGRRFDSYVQNGIDNDVDTIYKEYTSAYQKILSDCIGKPKSTKGVTGDNFSTYKYTPKQKANKVFDYFKLLDKYESEYGEEPLVTYALDLFCNILNEDCDVWYIPPSMPYTIKNKYNKGDFVRVESPQGVQYLFKCTDINSIVDKPFYELKNLKNSASMVSEDLLTKVIPMDLGFLNRLQNKWHFTDIRSQKNEFLYCAGELPMSEKMLNPFVASFNMRDIEVDKI